MHKHNRHFESDHKWGELLAKIVVAEGGGPIRALITGRERHPTGSIVCIKAGSRAVPWESIKAERLAILACEVASPVRRLLAQPHRLEIRIEGQRERMVYYPDLALEVQLAFWQRLRDGTPFGEAIRTWRPLATDDPMRMGWGRVIVEVKDDDDPRISDVAYRHKLGLARQVYMRLGWTFVEVLRSRDLLSDAAAIAEIADARHTSVGADDVAKIADAVRAHPLSYLPYLAAADALGRGPTAYRKLKALHVRRVVSIDLTRPLTAHSPVRLVDDGSALI